MKKKLDRTFYRTYTYRASEAIRSALEKPNPPLYLVNSPVLVSKETSVPKEAILLPTAPAKLIVGFVVNPTLALIPA